MAVTLRFGYALFMMDSINNLHGSWVWLTGRMTRLVVVTALFAVFASACLTGCVTATQQVELVHHTVASNPQARLPKNLLILPLDIQVGELSMAGVEEVPEWTAESQTLFFNELQNYAKARGDLQFVTMPNLNAQQDVQLQEHLALNRLVMSTAVTYATQTGIAWHHKRDHFDYTIGPGLQFLQQKTKANAAIILLGSDTNSSTGRVAANVVLSLLSGLPYFNGGTSFLAAGVIDLTTGNILWINWGGRNTGSFLEAESVRSMLDLVLGDYPSPADSER